MTLPAPILTPGRIDTPAPIQTLSSMVMGQALKSLIAPFNIHRVTRSINTDIGSDEYVAANGYPCTIQNDKIHIGIEIFANLDVVAVIALEGAFNEKIFSDFPEQGFQDCLSLLVIVG